MIHVDPVYDPSPYSPAFSGHMYLIISFLDFASLTYIPQNNLATPVFKINAEGDWEYFP